MKKYFSVKHKINQDNIHLLDIFNKAYFLNLGVIDYKSLKKLLNYQTIRLDKLVSANYMKEEGFERAIFYFQNIARKDISIQLYISYGLLAWKDIDQRQKFSPLCLIPINLFIEEDGIFLQQISNPIENSVLIKKLISLNKEFLPLNEKLNSIYSLDKYCLAFQKNPEFKIHLNNYISFAKLQGEEIIINHDKFNIDKKLINLVGEHNILMDEEHGLNLFPLNITQKNALVQAMAGNSFGIEGSMGSGKTTALVNIALNAISQGKRVLYLSNLDQTLENVENIFSNLQLDNYLLNLTKSFSKMTKVRASDSRLGSFDEEEIKESIRQNYHFLDQYEKVMFSRVRNNHILDVLNSLVILYDEKISILEIDSLENIYKHEFDEIVDALTNIEKHLIKFPDFKNSIWQNIPYTHTIKYPNQVITLIYKMHKHFRNLDNHHQKLVDEFGFKPYNSYIKIRELTNHLYHIHSVQIPSIWLAEDFTKFFEAKEYFPHLKSQLDNYHKTYNDIRYSYSLTALDIDYDSLLSSLYGKYFSEDNISKLDDLLIDRENIFSLVEQSNETINSFSDNLEQLKKDLDWDFTHTDEVFRDLNNLSIYLSTNAYHPEWLKQNTEHKLYRLIDEVKLINSKILSMDNQVDDLLMLYPKINLDEIDKTIQIVTKAIQKESLTFKERLVLAKFNSFSLEQVLKDLKTLSTLNNSLVELKDRYLRLTEFNFEYNSNIVENLENLYNLVKNINSDEHRKIIRKLLKERPQHSTLIDDGNNCNSEALMNFSDYYQFINNYIDILSGFDIKITSTSFIDSVKELEKVNTYLANLLINYNNFLNQTNLTDKTIIAKDLIVLKTKKAVLVELKAELYNNPKYTELYGQLYENEKTNIYSLEKTKKYFDNYIACFENTNSARKSFNEEEKNNILKILDNSTDDIESINELFKLYAKLFKDKISKYYYDSFNDNVEYLEHLLSSKDELISFLNITEELKVLIKYNLNQLIDYVINSEDENLTNNFKYTYYYHIWNNFISKYPFLQNTKSIEKCLQICSNLEKDLIDSNIVKIKKSIYRNYDVQRIRWKKDNLDYNQLIKKTSNYKRIVLSNTKILNYFVDVKHFDLVIIDDAHLSSSNEYRLAILGKQVIMAGEKDRDKLLKTNLISRMMEYNMLHLNYRYLPTPKNLLDTHLNLSGLILDNYFDNQGVFILEDDIIHFIYNLFLINVNYKINLFIRSYEMQYTIINKLIIKFQDSDILRANLHEIFSSKLNIVRLNSRLLFDADFNIIYLEEYYEEFSELNSLKMINDLFTVKQKVIIFDNGKYLEKASPNKFFKRLQEGILQLEMTYNEQILRHGLISKLNEAFLKHNIRAVGSHNDIDLVLEKNNILYGVLIFWDINTINYQTIEKYRKFYEHFKKNNWKIYIIWIVDLVYKMDETVEKIAKEIGG